MIPAYLHIRPKITKLFANVALVIVLVIGSLGLSFTPALASPQSQDANVNRQTMAQTQNRSKRTAKTKSELDRKSQNVAQTSAQQVTSRVESAIGNAVGTIESVANLETKESVGSLETERKEIFAF